MKEEEIKKQIAEILRKYIHYSPQLVNYVIHGAIEAIFRLMQEYAAQSAPKQSAGVWDTAIAILQENYEAAVRSKESKFNAFPKNSVNSVIETYEDLIAIFKNKKATKDESQQLQSQSFNYGYNENKQDEIYNENQDLKEVIEDNKRLVRELDIIINGENAAKQASLCDIVSQLKNKPVEKDKPKSWNKIEQRPLNEKGEPTSLLHIAPGVASANWEGKDLIKEFIKEEVYPMPPIHFNQVVCKEHRWGSVHYSDTTGKKETKEVCFNCGTPKPASVEVEQQEDKISDEEK